MEIEEPKQTKIDELNYDEDDDDFEEFEVEGIVYFWLNVVDWENEKTQEQLDIKQW